MPYVTVESRWKDVVDYDDMVVECVAIARFQPTDASEPTGPEVVFAFPNFAAAEEWLSSSPALWYPDARIRKLQQAPLSDAI